MLDDNGEEIPEINQTPAPEEKNKRFTDLSEKVKTTAEERDAATAKAEAAQKEVEFYKGFSKVANKYEGAGDYQDKILEKVNSGYDLEDATISVLAKAGKFNSPVKESARENPAGGSASTSMSSPDDKPISEMTKEEKRAKLIEFERENPGSLSQTLRQINL